MERMDNLPQVLLAWYEKYKRDLPWRQDRDPYHIWISEIMLQQTRVEAVKGYYSRFISALPSVRDLAEVNPESLQKLWEGLGYYSRMRNLQKAAKQIMEQYDGIFPRAYDQIRSLPGIGPYTAGAICSIAFDMPTPAVDGNVLRVMARLLNDDTPIETPAFKKEVTQRLEAVYPQRAGDFTQSLIELGATICGPNREPSCAECPCKLFCISYERGTCQELPVRLPKKQRRKEEKTVFILESSGLYGLLKRPAKGVLAGMWQFPNCPGKLTMEQAIGELEKHGVIPEEIYMTVEKKHIFTHIEWDMNGVYMRIKNQVAGLDWFTPEQITEQVALPTAFRQFWEEKHV